MSRTRIWMAVVSCCLIALAASALIPVVYSLTYYKQLQRRGEL